MARKLGGVSTSRPKAARLRDPPPRYVFGSFPKVKENIISVTEPVIPLKLFETKINQICVLESSQNVSADV